MCQKNQSLIRHIFSKEPLHHVQHWGPDSPRWSRGLSRWATTLARRWSSLRRRARCAGNVSAWNEFLECQQVDSAKWQPVPEKAE